MGLFNHPNRVIVVHDHKDTLIQSMMRGVAISVAVWFAMSWLLAWLHLPVAPANQCLVATLTLFAIAHIFLGAKTGRLLQDAVVSCVKATGLALFWIVKMVFSGIAQLVSNRKGGGSAPPH